MTNRKASAQPPVHSRTSVPYRAGGTLVRLLLGLLLVFSCRPQETTSLNDDLTQYIDQARLWAATEAQINNAIASVRQDQFVHDDFILETLRPAIGIAREYVIELENYEPQTPPLRNVHQGYIEAWRAHEFAMASVVDAVDKKDYIQLARANEELLEAQRSVSDVLAALATLLRDAGIGADSPLEAPPMPPGTEGGFAVSPS